MALDTASGRILAMIGGADFQSCAVQPAVQANRQPGSAFKPPCTRPRSNRGAARNRAPGHAPGPAQRRRQTLAADQLPRRVPRRATATEALVHSSNVAAVRLLRQTGLPGVVRLSGRLGITAPLAA